MRRPWTNIIGYALVAGIVCIVCTGCSASGPPFEKETVIPDGKGMLYIYQKPYAGPIAVTSPIYIYDIPVKVMRDGGYFAYPAYPGKTVISASQGQPGRVEVDVQEGEEYYIQCRYSWGEIGKFGGKAQIHLSVVPASIGEAEIVKCRGLNN